MNPLPGLDHTFCDPAGLPTPEGLRLLTRCAPALAHEYEVLDEMYALEILNYRQKCGGTRIGALSALTGVKESQICHLACYEAGVHETALALAGKSRQKRRAEACLAEIEKAAQGIPPRERLVSFPAWRTPAPRSRWYLALLAWRNVVDEGWGGLFYAITRLGISEDAQGQALERVARRLLAGGGAR